MDYDIVVVGCGPSSVFLAYELIQLNNNKKVLLIEKGKKVEDRRCPIAVTGKCMHCKPSCNITSGFSGAGAFSDGKLLSYHLSQYNENNDFYIGGNGGDYFKKSMTTKELKDLLTYTDNIYLKFGADTELKGLEHRDEIKKLQDKASKEDMQLIDIPLRHLGTEKAHELYKRIEDYLTGKVDMMFNTEVSDLIIKNNKVIGVKIRPTNSKEEPKTINAKKVVLAVGRKGANWLEEVCKKYNIDTQIGYVDIGIRYELPDKTMEQINKLLYEGKVLARPEPFKDRVRTFCQNPSGFVAAEVYDDDIMLVNGHSYKDTKSTNTNLAILVSHRFNYPFQKPIEYGINIAKNMNALGNGNIIVQRLGDINRGKRTWDYELANNSVVPTLKTAVPGDLTFALGYRTTTDILEFIRKMDKLVEGFADPDNLLYGPEIKFYSNELIVNKDFETSIKGLYSIGDGGGLTTGLMMASASGVKLARNLSEK
jgi:uncharacterized FAD-dependent dehydrogenase